MEKGYYYQYLRKHILQYVGISNLLLCDILQWFIDFLLNINLNPIIISIFQSCKLSTYLMFMWDLKIKK